MAQMTALRRRMIDDMTLRNLSPATQQSYVYAVAKFSRFFDRLPDQLGVADPRHLGAEIGLVAILHTWGQNLHHHPHVHCLVPGGGPSADRTRWVACRPGFFLPVKVLSRLYRRLFLTRLRAAFDAGQLRFCGALASLGKPAIFTGCLRPLRTIPWAA